VALFCERVEGEFIFMARSLLPDMIVFYISSRGFLILNPFAVDWPCFAFGEENVTLSHPPQC
jgi:hypothetical protein